MGLRDSLKKLANSLVLGGKLNLVKKVRDYGGRGEFQIDGKKIDVDDDNQDHEIAALWFRLKSQRSKH